MKAWKGLLKEYKSYLPITDKTPLITLNEGNTPLIKAEKIGEKLGEIELYFKYDGLNPTGSFKDRGMVMAVAKALEEGSKAIMCASTGNTSASAGSIHRKEQYSMHSSYSRWKYRFRKIGSSFNVWR